jgi:hypothetical protein
MTPDLARQLRYRRLVEALHDRGPRPVAEVLSFALRRLGEADRRAVIDQIEAIIAWSPQAIWLLGADRFPAPPLLEVA